MAREFAHIKLAIWSDDEYRDLTHSEQWLYKFLLTTASLSHAGVADWRPNRIAAHASDLTAEDVERMADGLIAKQYILVDEATEEVLVRSFVRHDELMKQPKMATAMATAHAAVASKVLRGVIVHELLRLREDFPELKGWGSEKASELLGKTSVDPSGYPLGKGSGKGSTKGIGKGSGNPSGNGSGEGSVKGSGKGNSTPSGKGSGKGWPTPAPNSSTYTQHPDSLRSSEGRETRATQAPERIAITDDMRQWAASKNIRVDLDHETEAFLDFHRAKGSTFKDWRAAWQTWMRNSLKFGGTKPAAPDEINPDDVLGPDYWSPPTPPQEIRDGPEAARRTWLRDQGRAHQAERLAEARAALARRNP